MIKIIDGAMGTMLQNAGLKAGECPEYLNITKPEIVTSVHRQYVEHGADIIETNTFGANRIKLSHYHLSDKVREINHAAVRNARAACTENTLIAASIGSTGKFIEPLGEMSFDEAYDVFAEQAKALNEAGVDMFIIETIIDIQEMRAALLAVKDNSDKKVICQLSFSDDGRTVTGTDPQTAAITLAAMGADVIGANCSLGPEQLLPIVEILAANCDLPISVLPNAGMPHLENGKTVFPMSEDEMGKWAGKLIAAGATYLGGCCGTTPAHIAALKKAVQGLEPVSRAPRKARLALTSRSKTVFIDKDLPTVLIGERINPTGRKKLAAEIKGGSFLTVKKDAIEQLKAGAQVLDVNMGVGGIDQAKAMNDAIMEIAQLVDAPLAIDTSDAAALEAGLKAYPGRALINSVSGEKERLEKFLPLAKRYGAAILCLPLSDEGIPKTAKKRLSVVKTIINEAKQHGLKDGDFLLDGLVMTIAADDKACLETLNTLRLYREELGYPSTMGLSNISFGLPNRPLINSHFFTMCLAFGLDAPIMNPYLESMQNALLSSAALLGKDKNARHYSIAANADNAPAAQIQHTDENLDILTQIKNCVISGEKEAVVPLVERAIGEKHSSNEITEHGLTAAMNIIGTAFGAGKMFLPQVLLSAEAMRAAFNKIKEILPSQTAASQGTVVIATVKGDIHDLGKNIVAALLENNGFKVIDLGKDVAADAIVKAARENNADIVGLCALMTTTMPQIDVAIQALKDAKLTAKTMVGGAVLTQEYADSANADCYAKDGVVAVNLAKQLMKK
jgi:5-methyltetrahydrofolate--homocysteine methyltransferase